MLTSTVDVFVVTVGTVVKSRFNETLTRLLTSYYFYLKMILLNALFFIILTLQQSKNTNNRKNTCTSEF